MDTCETCGAHWMQNCSWWCGLSDEQIARRQDEHLMSHNVKIKIADEIRALRVGQDKNVIANRLQRLLDMAK